MTMDPNTVRGLINQLLYTIQFTPDLTDKAKIASIADRIQTQRGFLHPASEYTEAIACVLADGHLPEQAMSIEGHSEGAVLTWLTCVTEQLNPTRPTSDD